MLTAYPIVLIPAKEGGYVVDVPDLGIGTQGDDIADALYMARDAISLWGVDTQDKGRTIPPPSTRLPATNAPGALVSFVDVDFDAYRRRLDSRMVRRVVTIPSWLNDLAVEANLDLSQIAIAALKKALGVTDR